MKKEDIKDRRRIIKINSEVIAEIKNALYIIQLNADLFTEQIKRAKIIVEQVERIDRLLPIK